MKKILALTKKEFIQTFRDRKMLMTIFLAPVLQLFLLGFAVNTDITHVKVGIWDEDNSQDSRRIIERVMNCGYFDYAGNLGSSAELNDGLINGKFDLVLDFPPDFSRKLKRGETSALQVSADGSDSNLAIIAQGYLNEIIRGENSNYMVRVKQEISGRLNRQISVPMLKAEMRVRYNPDIKSSHYMVPGVIALILTLTTMILTAMAMTREKELGTIEQIMVSPISPSELIIGKTIPFIIIGMVDVLLVVSAGVLIFDLPIRGSLLLLFGCSLLFILSTLGLGLFISTVSRTQQQALLTSFMFMFPAMILSGFVFPIANMPALIQPLSYFIPLRYFLVIIRGIILRGNGFSILWPQMAALLFFGIAILSASAMRFKKKLE